MIEGTLPGTKMDLNKGATTAKEADVTQSKAVDQAKQLQPESPIGAGNILFNLLNKYEQKDPSTETYPLTPDRRSKLSSAAAVIASSPELTKYVGRGENVAQMWKVVDQIADMKAVIHGSENPTASAELATDAFSLLLTLKKIEMDHDSSASTSLTTNVQREIVLSILRSPGTLTSHLVEQLSRVQAAELQRLRAKVEDPKTEDSEVQQANIYGRIEDIESLDVTKVLSIIRPSS